MFSVPALELFPSSHALSSRSISRLQLHCSFPLCTSVCSTTLYMCTGLSYLCAQNKPYVFVSLSAPHFLLSALSICIRCAMLCPPAVVPSPSCSQECWQHPGQSLSWAAPGALCSTAEQLISPRSTAQRGHMAQSDFYHLAPPYNTYKKSQYLPNCWVLGGVC